jgi:pentapeptide MXKDX repeat protein
MQGAKREEACADHAIVRRLPRNAPALRSEVSPIGGPGCLHGNAHGKREHLMNVRNCILAIAAAAVSSALLLTPGSFAQEKKDTMGKGDTMMKGEMPKGDMKKDSMGKDSMKKDDMMMKKKDEMKK